MILPAGIGALIEALEREAAGLRRDDEAHSLSLALNAPVQPGRVAHEFAWRNWRRAALSHQGKRGAQVSFD
jgi:hypothetical protein